MDESLKSKLLSFLEHPSFDIQLSDAREVAQLRERIYQLEEIEAKLRRELAQTYDVLGAVSNRNQELCDMLRDAGITYGGK